jgi:hypothetical protein
MKLMSHLWNAFGTVGFFDSNRERATGSPRPAARRFEALEERQMLTIKFAFNFTYDTNNFFNTQAKKDLLFYAGRMLGQRLSDSLSAITPSGSNRWTATITNPATGGNKTINNRSVDADTIVVYVGSWNIPHLAQAKAATVTPEGSPSWKTLVRTRGETGATGSAPTDVAPAIGSITFDSSGTNWHFGRTTNGLSSTEHDFVSVAMHELTHILGVTDNNNSWKRLISGGTFNGTKTKAVYGARVPVNARGDHFAEGVSYRGLEVAMDPSHSKAVRKFNGPVDFAALDDIGWTISTNDETIYQAAQELTHIPSSAVGTSKTTVFNTIASTKDVDFYRIYATKGSRLSVQIFPTEWDSYLSLFDGEGNLWKTGDQGYSGDEDNISYTFPRRDYYFVAVSSFHNSDFDPFTAFSGPGGDSVDKGAYTLNLSLADPSSILAGSRSINSNTSTFQSSTLASTGLFTSSSLAPVETAAITANAGMLLMDTISAIASNLFIPGAGLAVGLAKPQSSLCGLQIVPLTGGIADEGWFLNFNTSFADAVIATNLSQRISGRESFLVEPIVDNLLSDFISI